MAAGKSNTAAGRAVAGSHLWMQRLVEVGRFPTLARMFAAQLGEEVEWIAPLPQNDFKEYKLNQDEAMAKLFPHADKASLFDFWPSNQPQWDGIAIGRDSGALYLVEAKAHRKEAEGQKLGATAQESIDKIKDTLRKWHDAHFPQGDFSLWTDGHYQLANRLAFLYEMRARCVPHHFPDVRLILLNIVGDPTMEAHRAEYHGYKTTQEQWKDYYSDVFQKMLGTPQIPHGTRLLQLDVELMARYQKLKDMVTKRRREFAALMDFIEQQTAYLTRPLPRDTTCAKNAASWNTA